MLLRVVGSLVDELPQRVLELVRLALRQQLSVRIHDRTALLEVVQRRFRQLGEGYYRVPGSAVDPVGPTIRRKPSKLDTSTREIAG